MFHNCAGGDTALLEMSFFQPYVLCDMALHPHFSGAATSEHEESQGPKLIEQDLTHPFVSNHI
jgi:hypothetical protein